MMLSHYIQNQQGLLDNYFKELGRNNQLHKRSCDSACFSYLVTTVLFFCLFGTRTIFEKKTCSLNFSVLYFNNESPQET